jgi:thiol-disulfide isomerase/thioredoxin
LPAADVVVRAVLVAIVLLLATAAAAAQGLEAIASSSDIGTSTAESADGEACSIVAESCGTDASPSVQDLVADEPMDYPPNGICISYFYSPTCGSCARVSAYLEELADRYPRLYVHKMNILLPRNAEVKEAMDAQFGVPHDKRAFVPALYVGQAHFIGEEEVRAGLEERISTAPEEGVPCECEVFCMGGVEAGRKSIIGRFMSFSASAVIIAGLVDSINPCAIAGLIFFISYLAYTQRKGKEVLFIGILYSSGVFSANLLLGLWFKHMLVYVERFTLISALIYPATGVMALVFAALSYRDYCRARDGDPSEMTLQMPKWAKRATHTIVRTAARTEYLGAFAFFVGFGITFFEFLCTGQVYLPTIVYILGVPELRSQAMFYLVLYNLLFISPLIVVFVAAYLETTSKSMQDLFKKHVAGTKLAATLFFLLIGVVMLVTGLPELM